MINCAHPTHFEEVLEGGGAWRERVRGLRANASTKSHAELDEATELDDGDPVDLGARYGRLREGLPQLNVLGGCCGTDHRHVAEIRNACLRLSGSRTPSGLLPAPLDRPDAAGLTVLPAAQRVGQGERSAIAAVRIRSSGTGHSRNSTSRIAVAPGSAHRSS